MARKQNKRRKQVVRKSYAIVVDGETELWYFQKMGDFESIDSLKIEPRIAKKKTLKQQFEYVANLANQGYEKVFWLLDFDAIIHDNQIEKFKQYFRKAKRIKNVEVFVNSPCIEFWYLLHFKNIGQFMPKCETAVKQLKKHLPDYEKTEKYYKKANNDIYKRLKPNQEKAVSNARKLGNFDMENTHTAKAEVFRVLEALGIKQNPPNSPKSLKG